MWKCELYTFTRQSDTFCLLLSINSKYLQQEESDECEDEVQKMKSRSWSAEPRRSSSRHVLGWSHIKKHPSSDSESDLAPFPFTTV